MVSPHPASSAIDTYCCGHADVAAIHVLGCTQRLVGATGENNHVSFGFEVPAIERAFSRISGCCPADGFLLVEMHGVSTQSSV